LSFFKKKRFGDEGYERISRLIDERQRELDESAADLEEDTVVLAPQLRAQPREAASAPPAEAAALRRPGAEPMPSNFPPPDRSDSPVPFTEAAIPSFSPPPAPRPLPDDLAAATGPISLVAKEAVWDGKLSSTGDVRVEGRLQGEIQTGGTLYVAAQARVQGMVRARNVILAGEIEGQLRCEERLEILPGGSARGEIDTGTLVVHEGAFIESKFQMRREGVTARS
jgi:cytoskeletal protein CcmA (bactofilin family)